MNQSLQSNIEHSKEHKVKVQNTQKLLRYIARRLSGRSDCKNLEYMVSIGNSFDTSKNAIEYSKRILFTPPMKVYTDTYHRKDVDLHDIIDLIISRYFPECVLKRDNGILEINTDLFSSGTYVYRLRLDGKRRWIKYNSKYFQLNNSKR